MSITPIDPVYEPCTLWPVDPACLTDDWESLEPSVRERSLALASATLHRLSGYRVTNCPITVRPCKPACGCHAPEPYIYQGQWMPHIAAGGRWVNSCGCSNFGCSCTELCAITLPGPIGRVDEVLVGAVDLTAEVKVAGNQLIYTGGGDCPFPSCQDLAADPGEPDTFTVTYINGYAPDSLAAYAAGIMAMEYAKACSGKSCKLPIGTTSVVRQGVSIEIATGSFPNGMTGIREVDAWISLWRPEGSPKRAPRVWSPDSARIHH